jgi:hypothetical protein
MGQFGFVLKGTTSEAPQKFDVSAMRVGDGFSHRNKVSRIDAALAAEVLIFYAVSSFSAARSAVP